MTRGVVVANLRAFFCMHAPLRSGPAGALEGLNLPAPMLNRLLAAGFKSAADVRALQPSELAAETGLSLRDAVAALQQLSGGGAQTRLPAQTALELLDEEERLPAVPSCVRALDEMLGTGVPMGKITEFCGAPGLGKTQVRMCVCVFGAQVSMQLGIQLAVSVRTPSFLDGPSGHCIYIDTEGSFIPERVADIANSFVKHVHMYVPCTGLTERGSQLTFCRLAGAWSIAT